MKNLFKAAFLMVITSSCIMLEPDYSKCYFKEGDMTIHATSKDTMVIATTSVIERNPKYLCTFKSLEKKWFYQGELTKVK